MAIEFQPIRRPEGSVPIKHLVVTEKVILGIAAMHARARLNYHDLLTLLGPAGQRGSVRLITACSVTPNTHPDAPFEDAVIAAGQTLRQYKTQTPDSAILGIGTAVGIASDISTFLSLGFGIYYAGGTRPHLYREFGIWDSTQGRFYALDSNNRVAELAAENILIARNTIVLPRKSSTLRDEPSGSDSNE